MEWMDRDMAHAIAGVDLDRLAYQLDCRLVFFRSNRKTRQDLGLARVPDSDPGGRRSAYALDR